jgi:hypothetical protein
MSGRAFRLHGQHRRSKQSPTGRHAQSLGIRVGYWPCLRAPFIALDLGSHRFDLWFGLPSYKPGGDDHEPAR